MAGGQRGRDSERHKPLPENIHVFIETEGRPRAIACYRTRRVGALLRFVGKELPEGQVDFENIDQRDADQPAERSFRLSVQQAHSISSRTVALIAAGLWRPFVGDTVELVEGVLQRDVRVEAGTGGHNHVGRHRFQVGGDDPAATSRRRSIGSPPLP